MNEFHRHFWRGREGFTFVFGTCYSNPKGTQVTQKECHRRYAKLLESRYGCAARGAIRSVLNAAGAFTPETNYSCNCAKRSSTRGYRAWVSSPLGNFETFVSLRSGPCHPRIQVGDLTVTEPDVSATLKIPDRTSYMEYTRSCVAAILSG